MADTPNTGETANQEPLKNNVNDGSTTPSSNATDTAEVERLKKEAEQARMRANQLENELNEKKKAEEDAERKRLEEKEEYKKLAEQERAKRVELESEQERREREQQISETTNKVFEDYPQEVQELARDTGISLDDTSDEAQASFKEKLDKIASKVSAQASVSANNPAPTPSASKDELLARMRGGDKQARQEVISNLEGVKTMKRIAGIE